MNDLRRTSQRESLLQFARGDWGVARADLIMDVARSLAGFSQTDGGIGAETYVSSLLSPLHPA